MLEILIQSHPQTDELSAAFASGGLDAEGPGGCAVAVGERVEDLLDVGRGGTPAQSVIGNFGGSCASLKLSGVEKLGVNQCSSSSATRESCGLRWSVSDLVGIPPR